MILAMMHKAVIEIKPRTKFVTEVTVTLFKDNDKRIDFITENAPSTKTSDAVEHGGKLAARLALRKKVYSYEVKFSE
jgi:hypothetical protein